MNKQGLAGVVSAVVLLAGCGGSSSTDNQDTLNNQTSLNVPFAAVVGSESVACGTTYSSLGTSGSDVAFRDFRFYIHDLALVTDQGEKVPLKLDADAAGQNDRVALLDFRNTAQLNDAGDIVEVCVEGNTEANPTFKNTVQGTMTLDPSVTIASVEFTIGVPFNLNHANQTTAEEPLRNPGIASGMTWNWQNGYKFLAADVFPTGGVSRPTDNQYSSSRWNIHLGSTGCEVSGSNLEQGVAAETCPNENRITVTLPLNGIEPENAKIQIDYQALVSGSNLGQDNGGAPGCMSGQSDPECEAVFERLALPWGENGNLNGDPNSVVFSVIQR